MGRVIALDSETTGLDLRGRCRPFYISTCDTEGVCKCWRFPVDPYTREVLVRPEDREDVSNYIRGNTIVFHNAKFDVRALETIGIPFHWDFEETVLASHAVSSSDKHGLKGLALKYLEYSDRDERSLHSKTISARHKAAKLGWNIHDQVEPDYWIPSQLDPKDKSLEEYATQDAERTILLWLFFSEYMDKHDLRAGYEREKELLKVVYKMETDGITLNCNKLKETKKFLEEEAKKCTTRATFYAKKLGEKKVNLDSSKDLLRILFSKNRLNLPVIERTDKGQPTTRKEVLTKLYETVPKDSLPGNFLEQLLMKRKLSSGKRYLEGYEKLWHRIDDSWARLYPSLNLSGTGTTRFSSNNPNGQNISKKNKFELGDQKFSIPKLRDVFGPLPNKTWYAIDYSQLELRVFAAVSKEQSLIDTLNDGYDFHKFVASRIFKTDTPDDQQRTIAKNVNFALIFGAGPEKVNATAGIPNAYELFAHQFPNAIGYMQKIIAEVKKTGTIRMVDGYRLDIPLDAPYKAVNYLVQGTAGRIVKHSMVKIDKEPWFDWKQIRIVLQIHDELIIEVDNNSPYNTPKYIKRIMDLMLESGAEMGINTPSSCERITTDWGHGEEINVTDTEFTLAE